MTIPWPLNLPMIYRPLPYPPWYEIVPAPPIPPPPMLSYLPPLLDSWTPCLVCRGTGNVADRFGLPKTCPRCNGSGRVLETP